MIQTNVNIVATYDNYEFSAPIEYTLDLILSVYGVKYEIIPFHQLDRAALGQNTVIISYGHTLLDAGAGHQIHIYASTFFGQDYLKPKSMPTLPLSRYENLPIVYTDNSSLEASVTKSPNLIETKIDIIASSFFMVSRYEEVVLDVRDQHDRFPASASLAFKEGFLDRPIVNEYIDLLWDWIKFLHPDLQRHPLWPNGKEFAVCLTHDVDNTRRYCFPNIIRLAGSMIIRQRRFLTALAMFFDYGRVLAGLKKDPFDTFDYFLETEAKDGIVPSFYFMAGGNHVPFDERDTLEKSRVADLALRLKSRGCEIGLHPSFDTYNSPEMMAAEKAMLDRIFGGSHYGCRQHYLRFRVPQTWHIQEQLGFLYDTSMAFADHVGFRCGYCLPFRPFDLLQNRVLGLWELPLTVMETSLRSKNYQHLMSEEGYKYIVSLIETVKKHSGLFILLWHNSTLNKYSEWAGWKDIYEGVVKYIEQEKPLVTSAEHIVRLWQDKTRVGI